MRLSLTDGAEEKSRAFLTLDEVKELSETEYRPQNDIKPAFMFACFTGLRYSDIYKLTWGELTVGADGTMRLDTKMKKNRQRHLHPSFGQCHRLASRERRCHADLCKDSGREQA